jgi:hypothetical protein
MRMGREELTASVLYQIGALSAFLRAEGMELNHVKPHGSLYGMAARDAEVAAAIADAADVFGVPLWAWPARCTRTSGGSGTPGSSRSTTPTSATAPTAR